MKDRHGDEKRFLVYTIESSAINDRLFMRDEKNFFGLRLRRRLKVEYIYIYIIIVLQRPEEPNRQRECFNVQVRVSAGENERLRF